MLSLFGQGLAPPLLHLGVSVHRGRLQQLSLGPLYLRLHTQRSFPSKSMSRGERQQMKLVGGGEQDQKLKCDYGNRNLKVSEIDRWKKRK